MSKCFVEDCENNAPYGLRLPGILSALPQDKRGSLRFCLDHSDEANDRRDRAMGLNGKNNSGTASKAEKKTGDLFDGG